MFKVNNKDTGVILVSTGNSSFLSFLSRFWSRNFLLSQHKGGKCLKKLTYTLFLISNSFISNARLKLAKIKQMLSNILRLNNFYLKIIRILHPRYHPKIIGHVLWNKQTNKWVYIHEIIRLIIMNMKMKMTKRSHRCDINRPRSIYGHKYSKCKNSLIMMILTCSKQHLSNIWSSIHEKDK